MDRLLDVYIVILMFVLTPVLIIIGIGFWLVLIQIAGSLLFGWPLPDLVKH